MAHSSRKAVLTAIASNFTVTVIKFIAGMAGGSASMINEAVHSLMDTLNQGFLFLGLRESEKPADQTYAFGHGQKKYLWNLWSAIGLFSIGAGLGLAHAWHSWEGLGNSHLAESVLLFGMEVPALWMNLGVLAAAFGLEGYSFLVAMTEFLRRMRREGESNPLAYLADADDPTLIAIVLEDSAAMLGLVLAALGIVALIALMLGGIAFYLGFVNMRFLADIRDPEAEAIFREVVKKHPEVERYHDLRSIIIDEAHTVLIAEIELREEAIVADLYDRIRWRWSSPARRRSSTRSSRRFAGSCPESATSPWRWKVWSLTIRHRAGCYTDKDSGQPRNPALENSRTGTASLPALAAIAALLNACASTTPPDGSISPPPLEPIPNIREELASARKEIENLEQEKARLEESLKRSRERNLELKLELLDKRALVRQLEAQKEQAIEEVVQTKARLRSRQSRAETVANLAEAKLALQRAAEERSGSADRQALSQARELVGMAEQALDEENLEGASYLMAQARELISSSQEPGATNHNHRNGEIPYPVAFDLRVQRKGNVRLEPGLQSE